MPFTEHFDASGVRMAVGAETLEVRWFLPGPMPPEAARWFERFPVSRESREDSYLIEPWLDGLSVKVRADRALEVKMHRGSQGALEVSGRAFGRLDAWQKWSFELGPRSERAGVSKTWMHLRKHRTLAWFDEAGEPIADRTREPADRTRCAVEMTGIVIRGREWWTIGLEATGPLETRRAALESAARSVFSEPVPRDITLRSEDSWPYSDWLRRQRVRPRPAPSRSRQRRSRSSGDTQRLGPSGSS
jgi:hypothetical protein